MSDRENVVIQSRDQFIMHRPIGELLVSSGKMTFADVEHILNAQKKNPIKFGELAVKMGAVKNRDVQDSLDKQFSHCSYAANIGVFDNSLLTVFEPRGATAEAFRTLRNELLFRYFDKTPDHALAITGLGDHKHIAWCTANLAIVFSQLGKRTLLIDANLRESRLHALFGLPNGPGLANWLASKCQPKPVPLGDYNLLDLLNAGSNAPNAQELLASPLFKSLLKVYSHKYDIVLVNTAPLDLHGDGFVSSAQIGSALLIAEENKSLTGDIVSVTKKLRGLDIQLVGSTLLRYRG